MFAGGDCGDSGLHGEGGGEPGAPGAAAVAGEAGEAAGIFGGDVFNHGWTRINTDWEKTLNGRDGEKRERRKLRELARIKRKRNGNGGNTAGLRMRKGIERDGTERTEGTFTTETQRHREGKAGRS